MAEKRIVAFTGHREYPDRAGFLRGLASIEADVIYFGGARGADSDALEWFAKNRPQVKRIVVVPNTVKEQPAEARPKIEQFAQELIELHLTSENRYMVRNHYLVDHSNELIAFYDFRGKGGTYQTINYARSKGKKVTIFPLFESDENKILAMKKEEFISFLKAMRDLKIELSGMKDIIIKYSKQTGGLTVHELLESLGSAEGKRLEDYFNR